MAHYSTESPMEFEWQNGGPVDINSPFHQNNVQRFVDRQNQNDRAGMKRTHSAFESPEKRTVPSLREPASQPFLFNSPARPLSSLPPSFRTPRNVDLDFSSGPDAASSPDNADIDTPDQSPNPPSRQSAFPPADGVKLGRTSFFERLKDLTTPEKSPKAYYSNAVTRRVHKRRREERDGGRRRSLFGRWGGKDEDGRPRTPSPFLDRIFAALEQHPNVPMILSHWAYLMLNIFLVSFFILLVWVVWSAIQSEVGMASSEAESNLLADMAECSKNFVQNRCNANQRVPAVEKLCENWERCMNRDPQAVGRATVSATTFAKIFNSFVEPISWKTVAVVILGVGAFVTINNLTFGQSRRQTVHNYPPPYPYGNFPAPQGYAIQSSPSRNEHHPSKRPNLGNGDWDRERERDRIGYH